MKQAELRAAVFKICDQLTKEGAKVTNAEVIKLIGHSKRDVVPAVRQWRTNIHQSGGAMAQKSGVTVREILQKTEREIENYLDERINATVAAKTREIEAARDELAIENCTLQKLLSKACMNQQHCNEKCAALAQQLERARKQIITLKATKTAPPPASPKRGRGRPPKKAA